MPFSPFSGNREMFIGLARQNAMVFVRAFSLFGGALTLAFGIAAPARSGGSGSAAAPLEMGAVARRCMARKIRLGTCAAPRPSGRPPLRARGAWPGFCAAFAGGAAGFLFKMFPDTQQFCGFFHFFSKNFNALLCDIY
jgi:hypothetical protein